MIKKMTEGLTNNTTNEDKAFVPSAADWERFYRDWRTDIVNSLARFESLEVVEDAVQDAFLKMMGLSENRSLERELGPMDEGGWRAYLLKQAKWILGQEREKNRRWKPEGTTIAEMSALLVEGERDVLQSATQRRLNRCRRRQVMEYLIMQEESQPASPSDSLDTRHLRESVRRLVDRVCRTAGISSRTREAFILYVLDELSPAEVVRRVWGAPSSLKEADVRRNNLYVIKNRVIRLLRAAVAQWGSGITAMDRFLSVA